MIKKSTQFICLLTAIVMIVLIASACTKTGQQGELQVNEQQVQETREVQSDSNTGTDSMLSDLYGWCGKDVRLGFNVNSGQLTIKGNGKMIDYGDDYDDPNDDDEWEFVRRDMIRSIVIQPGVTSIGSWSFYECRNLTNVSIPDTVTEIGQDAFADCESIISVSIPDSVVNIREGAFPETTHLYKQGEQAQDSDSMQNGQYHTSDCVISDESTCIGYKYYEYAEREDLTSIIIPDGITHIGSYAFAGCSNLTSVTIPDSVISIGRYAFDECDSLTSITIPDTVTSIWYDAFSLCHSLTSVTVPDSVTFIGEGAFNQTPWLGSKGDFPVV